MKKLKHWEAKISDWVVANLNTPFSRSEFDCIRRIGDLTLAYTGKDVMEPFRKEYSTDIEALKYLVKNGGMERIAETHFRSLGLEEIPIRKASRGDLVYIKLERYGSMAVCIGEYSVTQGLDGLKKVQTLKAKRAWGIQ